VNTNEGESPAKGYSRKAIISFSRRGREEKNSESSEAGHARKLQFHSISSKGGHEEKKHSFYLENKKKEADTNFNRREILHRGG